MKYCVYICFTCTVSPTLTFSMSSQLVMMPCSMGVLQSQDTPLALGLVSHVAVLLSHTHHHALRTTQSHLSISKADKVSSLSTSGSLSVLLPGDGGVPQWTGRRHGARHPRRTQPSPGQSRCRTPGAVVSSSSHMFGRFCSGFLYETEDGDKSSVGDIHVLICLDEVCSYTLYDQDTQEERRPWLKSNVCYRFRMKTPLISSLSVTAARTATRLDPPSTLTHTHSGLFSATGPLWTPSALTTPVLCVVPEPEPVNSWGSLSSDKCPGVCPQLSPHRRLLCFEPGTCVLIPRGSINQGSTHTIDPSIERAQLLCGSWQGLEDSLLILIHESHTVWFLKSPFVNNVTPKIKKHKKLIFKSDFEGLSYYSLTLVQLVLIKQTEDDLKKISNE